MAKSESKLQTKTKFREISDDFIWNLNRCVQHYLGHLSGPEKDLKDGFAEPAIASVVYLSRHLLAKYNNPNGGVSSEGRRQAAIVKWLDVERRNSRTNTRITSSNPLIQLGKGKIVNGSYIYPAQTTAWDLLLRARGIVNRILGDCPTGEALSTFLIEGGGFTGGASTSKKRSLDTLARKYTERMDATPELLRLLHPSDFERVAPGWTAHRNEADLSPRLVKGNILFTVPKNAEIDRVACKEPDLNLFCQKAVGDFIRRRLRVHGVDLNDQTRNQTLAKHAYSRKYATIDLSSASDSLTTELVRQLVSPDWFSLLMTLRSPKTFIDGLSHRNAMISSMGNGFTFELESLVFYSIARAVQMECDDSGLPSSQAPTVGVFGDDLVINQRYSRTLIAMLGWCGFKVNASKSFIEGALFESCGKHYYCGLDVSPFYIHKPMVDISDLILALNQLRSWMIRTGIDLFETSTDTQYSFYEIWLKFKSLVPRSLHGGWDLESRTSLVTLGASRCKLVPKMRTVKRVVENYPRGMFLARLSGMIDYTKVSVNDLSIHETVRSTSEFPEVWTGEWLIRRYNNVDRFFGIATVPLYQEMV